LALQKRLANRIAISAFSYADGSWAGSRSGNDPTWHSHRTRFNTGLLVVAAAVTAFVIKRNEHSGDEARPQVEMTGGSIEDRALAVGTVERRLEIEVKSQIAGVVKRQIARAGNSGMRAILCSSFSQIPRRASFWRPSGRSNSASSSCRT
jgi:hypothetical protein